MAHRNIPKLARLLYGLIFSAGIFAGHSTEAPAASWATFLVGAPEAFIAPGIVAEPGGGFYLYSSGARPLIKFNANGSIAWEAEQKSGVNETRYFHGLDVLADGDVVVSVEADPNAPVFGHQAVSDGRWLLRLAGANGSVVTALPLKNSWVTAVKASPNGGFFVGGFGIGNGLIGTSEAAFGSGAAFVAYVTAGVEWVAMGEAAVNPWNYRIAAIRTVGTGASLKVIAAGEAPAAWNFGGKAVDQGGVFLLEILAGGNVSTARAVEANSVFSALESSASGEIYLALRKDSGETAVRRMDQGAGVGWEKSTGGSVMAMAVGGDLFAVGTEEKTSTWQAVALSKTGNLAWRRNESGRSHSSANGAALLSDGRLAIVGNTPPTGIFIDDYFLRDFNVIGTVAHGAFLATFPTSASAPIFRAQPRDDKYAVVGERVTLRAEVYSPGAFSAQWFKDDQELAGQTGTELVLPAARAADSGSYYLEARNSTGMTRSRIAEVVVNSITVSVLPGTDGAGVFEDPRNPIALPDGSILVADAPRGLIRRVNGASVNAFTGGEEHAQLAPMALAFEPAYGGPKVFATSGLGGYWRIGLSENFEAVSVAKSPLNPDPLSALAALEGAETMWFAHPQSPGILKLEAPTLIPIPGNPGFANVSALAADLRANLFVADSEMHEIRTVSPAGATALLAGHGMGGFQDGFGFVAMFNDPSGITLDESGNVYITERGNHAVRKISREGFTTTLAGLGESGLVNGSPGAAKFNAPEGLCFRNGALIVADTGNRCLRELRFTRATVSVITDAKIHINVGEFLRIPVEGNAGERFEIVSSGSLNADAEWKAEGLLVLSSLTPELVLLKPTETRFYRARRMQ